MKAPKIFCIPKNTGTQSQLRINWIIKNINGKRFSFVIPLPPKKIKDTPIIIKRTIQTGVKIQSGGVKKGLFKLSNHSIFFIFLV